MESAFDRLPLQDIEPMFPLRARGDLEPLPEKVEALGHIRTIFVAHVVERTHACRIIGNEHELVPERFFHVLRETPLTFRIEIRLVRDVVAAARKHMPSIVQRDPRKRRRRDDHVHTEVLLDLVAVQCRDPADHVCEPLLFDPHHVLVAFDPRDLHVDRGELGVVTRRERGVGTEDRADLEHAIEAAGHRHLFVELRRLRKVRGLIFEVRELEELCPGLTRRAHELRRMDLQEALTLPVLPHRAFHGGLHLEDGGGSFVAKTHVSPVHAQLLAGALVDRKRRFRFSDDIDRAEHDLDTAQLRVRIFNEFTFDRYGRADGQIGNGTGECLALIRALVHHLHNAGDVTNDHELHPPLVAHRFDKSADADRRADVPNEVVY